MRMMFVSFVEAISARCTGIVLILFITALSAAGCSSENGDEQTDGQAIVDLCPLAPSELESEICQDEGLSCDSTRDVAAGCETIECRCGRAGPDGSLTWSCADRGCADVNSEDARDGDEDEDSTKDTSMPFDSSETVELKFPCEKPPSELIGTSCDDDNSYCSSLEDVHPCCTVMGCRCNRRDRLPDGDLIWECANVGCADNAEECSSVCEVNPSADFCPPDELDATD